MMTRIQDGNKDRVDYVLVFKLSRFGRNAADVLNSVQIMEDYGVNLLAVEDNIDSAGSAGKLMISVIAAVAEIERENIQAQTMAGRRQKAKEGKWNGGQAPFGYRLNKEKGVLEIDEDGMHCTQLQRYGQKVTGGTAHQGNTAVPGKTEERFMGAQHHIQVPADISGTAV